MHYALDAGLQKLASFAYEQFLPQEVDYYLNLAQEKYIKNRLFVDDAKGGFATSLKHLEDVRTLIRENVDLTFQTIGENYYGNLKTDHGYYLQSRAGLEPTGIAGSTIPTIRKNLTLLANDRAYLTTQSPFGRSSFNFPKAVLTDGVIKVLGGKKFILKNLALDYVRTPPNVDLTLSKTSELPPHTHPEIVALAISIILEVIESPRFVTAVQQTTNQP